MADRVVAVRVDAKVSGAVAGLRKVKASVDDLTKADIQKPQKAFDDLANKGALMGGVVALGIGKAVASFADFDKAMSGVAANSGAAGAQLDALREKAIQLGSETQFSATEAAQGINELAKAGVSTQEILNGGLKGALDLAAAGQIGVAEAAETTASALNQFNQDGSQATHVADLLSNAANAAQGGVSDMGQALAQAGVAANAAGLNIDETTTLLALFAKAGLIGSDAGTSLKTMMQRLSAPTDAAASAMESLGINAYDAQGQFVGAEELIRQLSESTKNLSTESKMAAFNTIFGADAIRAASIAAAAGADGYKSMATEVTKAGGAAENAAKLTDNLKGDIERLGGSIETAFISGGSSANDALRTLAQGLGGVVDVVSKIPAPLLLASTGLAALALTLPKGISVYKDFSASLDTMGVSMDKINTKAPKLGAALRGLQGVAAGLTIAAVIGGISNSLTDLAEVKFDPQAIKNGAVSLDAFNKKMAETTDLGLPIATTISDFGQVLEATFNPGKGQEIDSFFATINSNLGFENTSDVEVARKRFEELDGVLSALASSGQGDAAARFFKELTDAAARQGITVDQLKSKLPGYAQALADLNGPLYNTSGSAAGADRALRDMADGGLAAVEGKAKDAKTELQDLLDLAESMAGGRRDLAAARAGVVDAGTAAVEAAKFKGGADEDALAAAKKAKDRLAEAKKSGTKSEITAAQEAVIAANKRVAESYVAPAEAQAKYEESLRRSGEQGDALIEEMFKQTRPIAEINKAYEDQRAAIIKAANARGIHGAAAEAEADKVSLTRDEMDDLRFQYANTQAYVDTQVRTPGLEKAKTDMEGYWEVINGVPTFKPTTVTTPGIGKAKADLDGVWEVVNGIPRFVPITISVGANISAAASGIINGIGSIGGTIFKRARGGPIMGVGTATSDSNLLLASKGEHVLTAAEVAAAGGHGAIFALRKAILSGGVAMRAQGGPIGAPMSAYRSAPPSTQVRVDLSNAPRGGDTFNMTAIGADADQAVSRGVRRLVFERSRS